MEMPRGSIFFQVVLALGISIVASALDRTISESTARELVEAALPALTQGASQQIPGQLLRLHGKGEFSKTGTEVTIQSSPIFPWPA